MFRFIYSLSDKSSAYRRYRTNRFITTSVQNVRERLLSKKEQRLLRLFYTRRWHFITKAPINRIYIEQFEINSVHKSNAFEVFRTRSLCNSLLLISNNNVATDSMPLATFLLVKRKVTQVSHKPRVLLVPVSIANIVMSWEESLCLPVYFFRS